MNFDINKPAWLSGDPRFESIKNIMLSVDAEVLLELLEEYKRIAILELPGLLKVDDSEKTCQQAVGKIDFINELVALLGETIAPNDEEVGDGE